MNALISLDSILEPAAALVPATLFGSGQVETILSAIEKDVRAEVFDITTAEGRERVKSVAYKIARSKTTMDEIGKEHVAEIKAQSAKIDKERRTLRDRLDALKEEVRGPLTAWEEAEADRVALHESALVFLAESARFAATVPSANCIEQRIESVRAACARDWQEFHERGEAAATDALEALKQMLAAAIIRERDAAELEALRKEKAEREERDRIEALQKAQAERAAQQAAERAEQERQRAEREAQWKKDAEERAAKQAEEAAARAVETERVRVAREKAEQEIAERKRQENKRNREKVHQKITLALSNVLTADETARLIEAIAAGKIPHVSINY